QAKEVEASKAQVMMLAAIGVPHVAKRARESMPSFEAAVTNANKLIQDINTGSPIDCSDENVTFLNSLQVSFAERYVASRSGNFDLVERMIKDQGEFRRG